MRLRKVKVGADGVEYLNKTGVTPGGRRYDISVYESITFVTVEGVTPNGTPTKWSKSISFNSHGQRSTHKQLVQHGDGCRRCKFGPRKAATPAQRAAWEADDRDLDKFRPQGAKRYATS